MLSSFQKNRSSTTKCPQSTQGPTASWLALCSWRVRIHPQEGDGGLRSDPSNSHIFELLCKHRRAVKRSSIINKPSAGPACKAEEVKASTLPNKCTPTNELKALHFLCIVTGVPSREEAMGFVQDRFPPTGRPPNFLLR